MNVTLPAGTRRALFRATGWAMGISPDLTLDGAPLTIRWFGDIAVAVHSFPSPPAVPIRLTAQSAPHSMTVQSALAPALPSPCDPVLPASLLARPRHAATSSGDRVRRLQAYLTSGRFELAMAETAEAWLADDPDESVAAASLMVSHLATHPLQRPDSLGALLATFCMSRVSP